MKRKTKIKQHRRRIKSGFTNVKSHMRLIHAKKRLKTNPYLLDIRPIPITNIKTTEFILNYNNIKDARKTITGIMIAILLGEKIPPIAVVPGIKGEFYVKDGHHRLMAYKLMGLKKIPAEIENPEMVFGLDFKSKQVEYSGPIGFIDYWKNQAEDIKEVMISGFSPDIELEIPTKEQLEIINRFKKKSKKQTSISRFL